MHHCRSPFRALHGVAKLHDMIPSVSAFSLFSSVLRRWQVQKCGICFPNRRSTYLSRLRTTNRGGLCPVCRRLGTHYSRRAVWFIHLLTTTTTNHTGAYLAAAARKNRRDKRKRRRKEGIRKEEELITNELRTYYTLLSHIKAFYQITEQIKNSPPNLTLISHITSKLIKPAAEKFESLAGGIP